MTMLARASFFSIAAMLICAGFASRSQAMDTARCPRAVEDETRHPFAAARVMFGDWKTNPGRLGTGALSPERGIWDMEIQWAKSSRDTYAYLFCDFENSRFQVMLDIPEQTAYCDVVLGYCRDAPTRASGERLRCPESVLDLAERKFLRADVQLSPYDGAEHALAATGADGAGKLWEIAKLSGVGARDGLFLACAYAGTPKIIKLRLGGEGVTCSDRGVCR